MVDYEVTKKVKLLEVNNDMCHNYYYLIYGKMYNEGKTKYRKFKYVEWFDIFDVQEYFEEKEWITNEDIKEYLNDLGCRCECVRDFDNKEDLEYFYNMCNESIKNYNRINQY